MIETFWTGILSGLSSGVVASVVASGLFFKYLTSRRPKITISDKLAHTENGRHVFRIMNVGKDTIYDVRAEAQLISFVSDGSALTPERMTIGIPLTKPDYFLLSTFDAEAGQGTITFRLRLARPEIKKKLMKRMARYNPALAPVGGEPVLLKDLLSGPFDHLRVRVYSTNSVSNFSDVVVKRYRAEDVVSGSFALYSLEMAGRPAPMMADSDTDARRTVFSYRPAMTQHPYHLVASLLLATALAAVVTALVLFHTVLA